VVDLVDGLLRARALPEQDDLDARFGQPPLTVYRGRRFFIQVLFWVDGTTLIHQHNLCGAFAVLAGGSLHSRYRFTVRERVNARLLLGDTQLIDAERLAPADVRPITYDLIHSVFHLEEPSATVLVRTFTDALPTPQYNYFPPHVALDPYFREPVTTRRLQALGLLQKLGDRSHLRLAGELIARSDFETAYRVLEQAARQLDDDAALEVLIGKARRRHGARVNLLRPVLAEMRRQEVLIEARAHFKDPDLRLFLALLLNLPDRASILRFASRKQILAWARAIANVDVIGVELDEVNQLLFECLLDGLTDRALLERFSQVYGRREVAGQSRDLLAQAARLRNTVFSPLFR
jgi:hypothetical protein